MIRKLVQVQRFRAGPGDTGATGGPETTVREGPLHLLKFHSPPQNTVSLLHWSLCFTGASEEKALRAYFLSK